MKGSQGTKIVHIPLFEHIKHPTLQKINKDVNYENN